MTAPFNQTTSVVLSIAGSDCSGGAGIQADLKTGAVFGVHVATAITAITAQNSSRFHASFPVTVAQLMAQITAVMDELSVDAVKIGMLASGELLEAVANWLPSLSVPVVLDPVIGATTGGGLMDCKQPSAMYRERLLPLVSLVTPNLAECAQLLGCSEAVTYEDMVAQAERLKCLGPKAVLLKGGHSQLRLATDVLVSDGVYPYSAPRQETSHTHGGGCSLAMAIAAGLAQGLSLTSSVAAAKTFIQGAITNSERLQLAPKNGPVHQFYQYW